MGVDYLVCENCGDTFSDCGYWVSCESCGTHWCSDECAEECGHIKEYCSKHPELNNRDLMEAYREKHCDFEDCTECEHHNPESCKYCRGEDCDDSTLLNKALELLRMSREDLIKVVNSSVERDEH